jgi:hypothetical protein
MASRSSSAMPGSMPSSGRRISTPLHPVVVSAARRPSMIDMTDARRG